MFTSPFKDISQIVRRNLTKMYYIMYMELTLYEPDLAEQAELDKDVVQNAYRAYLVEPDLAEKVKLDKDAHDEKDDNESQHNSQYQVIFLQHLGHIKGIGGMVWKGLKGTVA